MGIKEISEKINAAVSRIVNGAVSQYFSFEYENGEEWKIRVSNHRANPTRVDANTISLIVVLPEEIENEDDVCTFSINKKNFISIPNQYYVDENGEFFENFTSIEEMLEYHLD